MHLIADTFKGVYKAAELFFTVGLLEGVGLMVWITVASHVTELSLFFSETVVKMSRFKYIKKRWDFYKGDTETFRKRCIVYTSDIN